jgi:hypothetical protein
MTHPAVIQLSLATALPAYRPGDTVTALLHASTSLPEDIELKEVEIVFAGIERVDTSWVSPSYRKNTPAINSDRRRVQRHVVLANLQAATQGNFSDANLRRFLIRFKLPTWLPPTFKGTAVRYSYYLDAHLSYFQYDAGVVAAAAATGVDPPKQGTPGSISTRLALHIWPDQEANSENTATNTTTSSSQYKQSNNNARGGGNSGGSDVFPLALGEDAPIKCWEVGPGTAVEDAISHISKLVTTGSGIPASPFSPGRMKTSLSRQQSSGPLLGGGAGSGSGRMPSGLLHSDSASEISYDEGPNAPSSSAALLAGSRQNSSGAPPSLSRLSLGSEQATERSNASISTATTTAPTTAVQSAEAGGAGGLRTFALRIADAPLVKVSIHPPLLGPLQPGSTVTGTLEFPTNNTTSSQSSGAAGGDGGENAAAAGSSSGQLRCMQVSVMLETEESVDSTWRPVGKGSNTTSSGAGAGSLRKLLEEQIEVTADTTCTNFIFSLPRDATPTFQTPLVALRWVLRFHFMAMRPGKGAKIEQLNWTLPLVVLPPPKAA